MGTGHEQVERGAAQTIRAHSNWKKNQPEKEGAVTMFALCYS
jgi:hypothetical protein